MEFKYEYPHNCGFTHITQYRNNSTEEGVSVEPISEEEYIRIVKDRWVGDRYYTNKYGLVDKIVSKDSYGHKCVLEFSFNKEETI